MVIVALLVLGLCWPTVVTADAPHPSPAVARALEEAEQAFVQLAVLPVPAQPVLVEGVHDPFFAYLIGLLDGGIYGEVTRDHLARAIAHAGRRSSIPHELVACMRRAPARDGRGGWVEARFTGPIRTPVPYSLLGYHPGSLVSAERVTMEEWRLGRALVSDTRAPGAPPFELVDVTLWGVVDGEVMIDIHAWVDRILGGRIDDTYVVGVAIFSFEGERMALALGFNADGHGSSGALDLRSNKIRFPAPDALKIIARDLRGRIVQRLAKRNIAAWVPPERR